MTTVGIQSGRLAPRWRCYLTRMLVGKAGEDLQCSFPMKLPEVVGLLLIVGKALHSEK